jgi:hypothetical protein
MERGGGRAIAPVVTVHQIYYLIDASSKICKDIQRKDTQVNIHKSLFGEVISV